MNQKEIGFWSWVSLLAAITICFCIAQLNGCTQAETRRMELQHENYRLKRLNEGLRPVENWWGVKWVDPNSK